MSKPSPVGTVMIAAARAAGRSLARDFGEVENLQVSKKGPADFVSNADHRAEEIIYSALAKARPGYGFVMEERGIVEGTDKSNRFIVDPLDGTLNFLHGQPHRNALARQSRRNAREFCPRNACDDARMRWHPPLWLRSSGSRLRRRGTV